jgi:hypothetical protein
MSTALIISRCERELSPLGFIRKKSTWNRAIGALVEVVDIQLSKTGDSVTMNAGVLSRRIYSECWGRSANQFVDEAECTVRARIGQLIDGKDRWWSIDNLKASEEVVECIELYVIPFFARMKLPEEMCDWLVSTGAASSKYPPPTIYLALLQAELGNIDAACTTLVELERRALGAWKGSAQDIARRIGCGSVPDGMNNK